MIHYTEVLKHTTEFTERVESRSYSVNSVAHQI